MTTTRPSPTPFPLCVLAAAAAALAGCESPGGGDPGPMPADMQAIQDARDGRPDTADAVAPQPADGPVAAPAGTRALAVIERIELPLDSETDAAWALVDETESFPALTRGVWRSNGVRIGLLHVRQREAFSDALPGVMHRARSQLVTAAQLAPVRVAPPQPGVTVVDLTIPPRAPQLDRVRGGRIQLLGRLLDPATDGDPADTPAELILHLIPHHHKPKVTVRPRTPAEKALDGRVYHELGVRVHVPADRVVVLGLWRPPVEPEETTSPPADPAAPPADTDPPAPDAASPEPGTGTGAATQPADGPDHLATPDDTPPPPRPIPHHLGRALFTGQRHHRAMQIILIIDPAKFAQVTGPGGEAVTDDP